MTGTGEGSSYPGGDNRLIIDAITTQMERMMREHIEGLYGRIEKLENQENHDDDGGRRRRRRETRVLLDKTKLKE